MTYLEAIVDVLDYAIEQEERAFRFYSGLARVVSSPDMKKVFEQFAGEELVHRKKLSDIQGGRLPFPALEATPNIQIKDYEVEPEPTVDMNYKDALLVAMRKEKAAFRLYSDLASSVPDSPVRDVFLLLAQEEARHKLRFELEYERSDAAGR
ncbi:MAG: ferritin family protein [Acidobacteriota bacterium]